MDDDDDMPRTDNAPTSPDPRGTTPGPRQPATQPPVHKPAAPQPKK